MIAHRDQARGVLGGFAAAIGGWQQMKSRRWAHTSLRRVSPMRTMASTWVAEPSFTMPPSHITGTGARWKRFLSRASLMDIRYGPDPQGPMPCSVKRSFGGRGRELEKTAIAY
jgi:hypothetical protein